MRSTFDIIADKRDGKKLSAQDIKDFLNGFLKNEISDYQMSAMLMAVYIRSLDHDELSVWANTMLHSGAMLDFSDVEGIKADKHSTGGVGDKISIPLAPVLGALGFKVPMISGRGLGHTGGTLDKLESIKGFNVNISIDEFRSLIKNFGVGMIGQTPEIAPLDKRLYALRDVTATVASIPLIASSIMSKKMAEGIDGLILDVKVGRGAFMKDLESAKKLGHTMKGIGEKLGKKVTALFTNMDEPLGYTIGNALEIKESIDVLSGKTVPQVTELVELMAAKLLVLFGKAKEEAEGRIKAKETIGSGRAMEVFHKMVELQGGDLGQIDHPDRLPSARYFEEVKADKSGILSKMDALSMGKALVRLGGGRSHKEDEIDPAVGVVIHHKVGENVNKGDALYTVHYNHEDKLTQAKEYLDEAILIEEQPGDMAPLILGSI